MSDIKLDFFLKQNGVDTRIVLGPGEISWCDYESSTKSMMLYERKSLIKVSTEETEIKQIIEDTEIKKRVEELIEVLQTECEIAISTELLSPLEEQKKIVDKTEKPEKKYTGKKRGRKKKRGPKPGSKRNKGGESKDTNE